MTTTEETTDEPARFHDGQVQKMLLEWWRELTENRSEGADPRPNRRGERAELRRCRTPDEVLLTEAYHRARGKFTARNIRFSDKQLGAVVGLLAHVKDHQPVQRYESLGVQMASSRKNSDGARLSGLRFRRLLQIDEDDKFYEALRRVVRLLDGKVDVNQLAKDVFYYLADDPEGKLRTNVRKNWARDYYETAPDET